MRHLKFESRDKWCYGIGMLAILIGFVLLFSGREKIGNALLIIFTAFVASYAFGRGHATAFSRHKDSDEKDDHVA